MDGWLEEPSWRGPPPIRVQVYWEDYVRTEPVLCVSVQDVSDEDEFLELYAKRIPLVPSYTVMRPLDDRELVIHVRLFPQRGEELGVKAWCEYDEG